MVDLSSLLGDEDLRRRYGTPTLDRAWDYVRRGHVLGVEHDLDSDGDLDIRGTVAGSTSAPYVVTPSASAWTARASGSSGGAAVRWARAASTRSRC